MISDAELMKLSAQVGAKLLARKRRIVTAESCTGGWIAKVLTDISGSSDWYLGGVVAYSNHLKEASIGVNRATLAAHGAVSEPTAREMALGALQAFGGDVAIAVTGIAGTRGGTADKPVGTVWLAWVVRVGESVTVHASREVFPGDRESVRRASVHRALAEVLKLEI